MFKNIVVPLDGSDLAARALKPAAALADYLGSTLKLVAYHSAKSDELELTEQVCSQMRDIGDHEFDLETGPLTRPVADLLNEIITAAPHPLVVMSTRGQGRAAGLSGSVATDVLARISVPVMLIGPECEVGGFRLHGPVVVATDESSYTEPALTLAAEVCATLDYQPLVVNVIDPKTSEEANRARRGPGGSDLPPESAMVHRFADELGHKAGRPAPEYRVLHDTHPGKALAELARDADASAIIMATHARTGLSRLRHGSEAGAAISHAPCPVIAVAPDMTS